MRVSAVLSALDARHRRAPRSPLLATAEGAVFSTADLCERIERWGELLERHSARVVATRLDNGPDWLALDLAIRARAAVHVPIPTFFSPAQAAHALAESGADLAVEAGGAPAQVSRGVDDYQIRALPGPRITLPAATACITYTSGTTGQPKGVCLDATTLETVAASLLAATAAVAPRVHLCALPLATLLEQVAGLYAPILSDAVLAIPALGELGWNGSGGLDIPRFMAALARYRPQSVILVPQMLAGMVQALEAGAPRPDSLRFIAVGGARVGAGLLARAWALGLPVYEGYGLSECASVVCLNRPGRRRSDTVGPPLDHAAVTISPDGEVLVGGPRMLGYVGRERPAAGAWATGDLGTLDAEGCLRIQGRRRNVFITAYGRNVSPEWVEAELLQHAAIAQAAVYGEARPWNVAVIVPARPDLAASAIDRAVEAVNAGLPDYARIGAWIRAASHFHAGNGLATANGRPCRAPIWQRHAAELNRLYESATIS